MAAKILTYVPRYVTKTNDLALHRGRQVRDGGAYSCVVPIGPTPTSIRACPQTVGKIIITPPGRGAEYCDQPVCLCVCLSVREHISGTVGPISRKFCMQIPCGRGSVLLRWRCGTLCTSGSMDDVTLERDAGKG